jgi:hypothetical protein
MSPHLLGCESMDVLGRHLPLDPGEPFLVLANDRISDVEQLPDPDR